MAIDGTKIKANASKHKAMSHKRMHRRLGADKRGDELPDHLRTKQKRLEKINEALEALKREAEEQAAEDGKDPAETRVADKAQKNFTDPDSRILKTGDGFVQGYNAQAAVDTESQVIVAHDIFADGSDQLHLAEMVEKVVDETGQVPERVVADAGYTSEEGVREIEAIGTAAFIATARSKHEDPPPAPRGRPPADLTAKQRMNRELLTKRGKRIYARRKTSVEPVFGQVKQGRGFERLPDARPRTRRQGVGHGLHGAQHREALAGTVGRRARVVAVGVDWQERASGGRRWTGAPRNVSRAAGRGANRRATAVQPAQHSSGPSGEPYRLALLGAILLN